jgi:hypothetical protein
MIIFIFIDLLAFFNEDYNNIHDFNKINRFILDL